MADKAMIICVSVSQGNTAAVARSMAAVLKADIREPEQVDPQTLSAYDVVGFGSGIFAGSHHPRLRQYVEHLPSVDGTRAFVFTTAGMGRAQSLPWQRSLESVFMTRDSTWWVRSPAVGSTPGCRCGSWVGSTRDTLTPAT